MENEADRSSVPEEDTAKTDAVLSESLQIWVKDWLTPVTRKERTILLGVSTIGVLIAKTGLVPTRISALGIEFSPTNRAWLLRVLAAIVAFFFLEFFTYAWADFVCSGVSIRSSFLRLFVAYQRNQKIYGSLELGLPALTLSAGAVSLVRNVLEFFIPLLLGMFSLACLLQAVKAL